MTLKWILVIKKSYREIRFRFDTIEEAHDFLLVWVKAKAGADRLEKGPDEYTIIPDFGTDEDETEDDVPDSM